MSLKGIVALIVLIAVVIFTAQNYEVVEVQFLAWSFTTSRALLVFSVLVLGVVVGWLTASRRRPPPDKTPQL